MSTQDEAVVKDVVADTTPPESTPEEKSEAESDQILEVLQNDDAETDSKTKEAPKDVAEEQSDDTPKDDSEETAEETKPRGKEKREQQLTQEIDEYKQELGIPKNQDIRDLVSAKNALAELAKARNLEAQVAQEQNLLNEVDPETGEPYTPAQAERIARQQYLANQQEAIGQQRYELEVQQNQMILSDEADRALKDFPIFDSSSDQYIPEIAADVDTLLGQNLIFDDNNQVVGSNVSPYQLYKTVADAYKASQVVGQLKAQKATDQMLAHTDSVSSAAPKPTKKDPLLEILASDD